MVVRSPHVRQINLDRQQITSGTLVVVHSTSGLLAYPSGQMRRMNEMRATDTIRPEMNFHMFKLPIGSVALCLEYSISEDMTFFARILYCEKVYEVFGRVGDFETLQGKVEDTSKPIY